MVRRKEPEVVYVERDNDSSVKWLLWGAAIGGALALLYAPRSGEETRRSLQRNLWKLRAMTEEKLDELVEQYVPGRGGRADSLLEEGEEEDETELDDVTDIAEAEERPRGRSARAELEQRLAQARARRRAVSAEDDEEPLA